MEIHSISYSFIPERINIRKLKLKLDYKTNASLEMSNSSGVLISEINERIDENDARIQQHKT